MSFFLRSSIIREPIHAKAQGMQSSQRDLHLDASQNVATNYYSRGSAKLGFWYYQ